MSMNAVCKKCGQEKRVFEEGFKPEYNGWCLDCTLQADKEPGAADGFKQWERESLPKILDAMLEAMGAELQNLSSSMNYWGSWRQDLKTRFKESLKKRGI